MKNIVRTIQRRSGVTLIELLVTMAVMLIVLGLVYGIALESGHATQKVTRYQMAIQYCEQVLQQASETVGAAVDPAELAVLKDSAEARPVFKKNEMAVLTLNAGRTPDHTLSRVRIRNIDAEGSPPVIGREVTYPLAKIITKTVPMIEMDDDMLGGVLVEDMKCSIRFAYAATPAEPGNVADSDYKDTWTSPGLPALVRISVVGKLDGDPGHPIELQTAVIPGLVAGGPKAAPDEAIAAPPVAKSVAPTATPAAPTATPVAPPLTPATTVTPAPPTATPAAPTATPTAPAVTPAATPALLITPAAEPAVRVIKPDSGLKTKSISFTPSTNKEARA